MAAAAEFVSRLDRVAAPRIYPAQPEFEALLACCRQIAEVCPRDWLSPRELNWEKFIELAENQRVIPQVYRALEPYSTDLPSAPFAILQRKYKENVRNALWFTQQLARVVRHFDALGIRAIPYKGPVLAETLYGDVAARQYQDLDVLILPEDVNRAKGALADLGYSCALNLREEAEPAYLSSGYEYSFDCASRVHAVELQWQVLPRFYSVDFDLRSFFARVESVSVAGCRYLNLCAEDLLLILCVHAAKHLWAQISWLLDISKLVQIQTIDWEAVWEQAEEFGIRRIVALNLRLAHDLLGTSIPDRIHEWLEADGAGLVVGREILMQIREDDGWDTQSLSYFRLMSRIRERGRDKTRMWWRLLCTPSVSEWDEIHLPKAIFRFYPFVRLLRLAKRFAVAN